MKRMKQPISLRHAVALLSAIFSLFLVCACARHLPPTKALLGDDGEIFLYLEPFPQDSGRLSFTLAGISAVRGDGVEIPLDLKISDYRSTELRRQRLMAVGTLPAGEYSGFSFSVKSAKLKSEEGDAALLVPDKPEKNAFPFEVKKKSAAVVSMTFRFRESIRNGFGFSPSFAMEIPANPLPTLTGYVSNEGSNTVTVFDKKAGKVAKVIETGRNPAGMVIDQAQMKAYVTLSGDDAVEAIDVMENEIVFRIPLRTGDAPRDIAVTPDGRTLLTVNSGSNTVSIVDPVSQAELARLTVGNKPVSVLLDRQGRRAFVVNSLSNSISVIDIANRSISGVISTESGPLQGQLNRKGDRLYVCHSMSPTILVIDTFSLSATKRFHGGMGISALKVNPLSDMLYVAKEHDSLLEIFDPFSFIPGDTLATSGGVAYMAIDGEERNMAILHPEQNTVQLVNLTSKKEVAVIDVGDEPHRVSMFGER